MSNGVLRLQEGSEGADGGDNKEGEAGGLASILQFAAIAAQLGVPFLESFLKPSFGQQLGQQTQAQRAQLPFLRAQAAFPGFGQKERLPGQLRQQDLANLASSLGIGRTLRGQQQQRQFQGDILSSLRGLA